MPQLFTTRMDHEQLLEGQDRPDETFNDVMRAIDMRIWGEVTADTGTEAAVPSTSFDEIFASLPSNVGNGNWDARHRQLVYFDGKDWRFIPWSASHIWYNLHASLGSGLRYVPVFDKVLFADSVPYGVQAITIGKDWGTLDTTRSEYILICDTPDMFIETVDLVSDAASTSSSGNYWGFQIRNITQADDYFTGTPNTFDDLGDFVADTRFKLVEKPLDDGTLFPIVAGDVIELQITKAGTPGDLTRLHVQATFSTAN